MDRAGDECARTGASRQTAPEYSETKRPAANSAAGLFLTYKTRIYLLSAAAVSLVAASGAALLSTELTESAGTASFAASAAVLDA